MVQKAQQGIKARKVIQQALHSLGMIGRALRPVLAPLSFVKFGVQLLDIVAGKIAGNHSANTLLNCTTHPKD